MYKNCIELELNLAAIGDKDCQANARKLFESALTTYDQDVNLWRDYYSMEIKVKFLSAFELKFIKMKKMDYAF